MHEQSLLQQAIAAVRAGRRAEARELLKQLLRANPRHEQAWLWMGAAVESDAARARCLQQVLAINPHNAAARKGWAQLRARAGAAPETSEPEAAPPTAPCPRCGATNRVGAKFCYECGHSLEDGEKDVHSPSQQAQAAGCPACGFDNPAGAQFCGRSLEVGSPAPPAPPSPPRKARPRPEAKPQPAQGKRRLGIAGVALEGLFALGICGVGGWLVYQRLALPANEPTAVAVGNLTLTVVVQETAEAKAQPISAESAWKCWRRCPTLEVLQSVAMVSQNEGWAIGHDDEEEEDGIILHYSQGVRQSVPNPTEAPLMSVAMVNANEGWAVGEDGVILHYAPAPTE